VLFCDPGIRDRGTGDGANAVQAFLHPAAGDFGQHRVVAGHTRGAVVDPAVPAGVGGFPDLVRMRPRAGLRPAGGGLPRRVAQ